MKISDKNKIKIITNLSVSRASEFKKLRIQALGGEVGAFATSAAEERAKPANTWADKLKESLVGKYKWFVFAEDDGKLVGVIGAYREKLKAVSHTAHIVSVYVDPLYRGQGVGTKLFQALFTQIKKSNVGVTRYELNVTVGRTSAIALYKRVGFKKAGVVHKAMQAGPKYVDQYIMEFLLK